MSEISQEEKSTEQPESGKTPERSFRNKGKSRQTNRPRSCSLDQADNDPFPSLDTVPETTETFAYAAYPGSFNVETGLEPMYIPAYSATYMPSQMLHAYSQAFQSPGFTNPYHDWQHGQPVDYVSGAYGGGELFSTQDVEASSRNMSYGYANPYNTALYSFPQASPNIFQANPNQWRGPSSPGNHRRNNWNAYSSSPARIGTLSSPRSPLLVSSSENPSFPTSPSYEASMNPVNMAALAQVAQEAATQTLVRAVSAHSQSKIASTPSRKLTAEVTSGILKKVSTGKDIPPPVPSLFAAPSLEEALEQSLFNPNQTTNVYIRGLPPDTTDTKLLEICERFGEITSSKAIMDVQTNTCKGFGFACFRYEVDATACIAGLIHCGYQVSFAKESFSTRLKNLQDPDSTNLYLSNLPLDMHEKELEELFQPYKVVSNRVLRDSNNVSRGVGFARMGDRESAEAIIEKFDNTPVDADSESLLLQVRFADSPLQKRLKGLTQRRRQWRAREYNILTGNVSLEDTGLRLEYSQPSTRLITFDSSNSMSYDMFDNARKFQTYASTPTTASEQLSAQPRTTSRDLLTADAASQTSVEELSREVDNRLTT